MGDACGPTVVLPSPKSNVNVAIGLVPATDVDASAVTVSGAGPVDGVTARYADGGTVTLTTADVDPVTPAASVIVTVTVNPPVLVYTWLAAELDCGPVTVPSPKSNV